MSESNSNTMDWHRRHRSLLYFIILVILMILLTVWLGERLKQHIDRKMPELGLHDENWMEESIKTNIDTKAR